MTAERTRPLLAARALVRATALAIAALSMPLGAAAQIGPVGGEFQINGYTAESQRLPAVAADADGAFVVAWTGYNQDGSSAGVFGQRYDDAGRAVGTEFQVNVRTASYQRFPAVASLVNGGFVVVWESYQDGDRNGVFGRRYDSVGDAVGAEFQVNDYTTSYQRSPAVASGANGAFAVVWESYRDAGGYGVFGQRYDSAGQAAGGEFQINDATVGYQRSASIAMTAEGAFVVAWENVRDGESTSVFARLYDSVGQPANGELQVSVDASGYQPAVAVGANTAFLVAWQGSQDGDLDGVFARLYDREGRAVGIEFQVNSYTTGNQRIPAAAVTSDGTFIVAWENDHDGSSYGVFGQRYDDVGQRIGTEFQVNSYTIGYQRLPAVAGGPDGSFVAAWQSIDQDGRGPGVFGQRFGEPVSTPTATATGTETPTRTRTAALSTPIPCAGDCDGAGAPSVDELVTGVTIALGHLPILECPAFDIDRSGRITIDELIAAVAAALSGCAD